MSEIDLKKLVWDSEFFNKKIFSLTFDQNNNDVKKIDDILLNNNADVCYLKTKNEINTKHLFHYESTYFNKINIFRKKNSNTDFEKESHEIEKYDAKSHYKYYENIIKLALLSGHKSRFCRDTKFSNEQFTNLYKKWIDNTINESFGDGILLYIQKKELAGMVTFSSKDNVAKVGLIATKKKFQGKGIGQKLVKSFENNYAKNNNIDYYEIVTQGDNIAASHLYKKKGYSLDEVVFIEHLWRKNL